MYFDSQDSLIKSDDQTKTVYIYENSCNNKEPIQYKIRNNCNILKDIARIFKYKKIRLFNEEGAQYFQDDLKFVKNKTSLYASKGEQFDPHNCFGQYEIIKKLGQGGFGQVFLANHKHTGQKCAIKIININSSTDIDSIFVQAEILKSLKHQNIVKVTNCLTLKNMQVAIIMQYLEGGQLLQYVSSKERLDQQTCKLFCKQIVKGIMYCHENNLIHRDLKLQNIVLVNTEEKKIKIIDFGIAGVMNRLTQQDLDTGSLGYMAPECFLSYANNNANQPNVKFDGRMDVWAIGVCIFGMLVGDLPFKGATNHEIKEMIKKSQYKIPVQIKKCLSKQCMNVLFRCLDPNPKSRIKIGQLMNHPWFADKFKIQLQHNNLIANINSPVAPIQQQVKKENESEIIIKIAQVENSEKQKKQNKQIEKQNEKQNIKIKQFNMSLNPSHMRSTFMRTANKSKSNVSKTRSNVSSVYKTNKQIAKNKGKENIQKLRV